MQSCPNCSGTGRTLTQTMGGAFQVSPCYCPESEKARTLRKAQFEQLKQDIENRKRELAIS